MRRKNSLREGFIYSDFNTADQLKLEVFVEPAPGVPLAQAAVAKLVAPAAEIGGDSRLELPPANRIKTETRVVGDKVGPQAHCTHPSLCPCLPRAQLGAHAHALSTPLPPSPSLLQEYTLIAFPSETITRSGYQVRRKNLAVAATRRGQVYVLGCSARSDQFDDAKRALFEHVVDSFRVY